MNVVNISLDPKILDRDTPAAIRVREYGELVNTYTVVVPTPAKMTVKISDSATVFGINGTNKIVQLWNIYRKLSSLIKEGKCDVIASADMYYLGLVALFLARRHHVGLEINVLGIEKLTPLRHKIAKYVLRHASVIRALSHRLEGRLIKEFHIPKENINVISIFVPTDTLGLDPRSLDEIATQHLDSLRREFRETHGDSFNFLTVSRLVPIKRIELQLQAAAKLVEKGKSIKLHIVGMGPEEDRLRGMVQNLKISDHVIFYGRKTGYELGVFYFECDCFVLSSDYEGWGMVVVEAATAGLPVIMTDVGCAGEFLLDGEGGMVVPIGNSDALANAMESVTDNAELRERFSFGAKKALDSLESFDEILKQYKENWEIALKNKL